MNSSFLKMLKIDNNQLLSREHLKNVTGGDGEHTSTLDGNSAASIVVSCADGSTRTCSGNNCTGQDNVGCSCDGGTVSEPC